MGVRGHVKCPLDCQQHRIAQHSTFQIAITNSSLPWKHTCPSSRPTKPSVNIQTQSTCTCNSRRHYDLWMTHVLKSRRESSRWCVLILGTCVLSVDTDVWFHLICRSTSHHGFSQARPIRPDSTCLRIQRIQDMLKAEYPYNPHWEWGASAASSSSWWRAATLFLPTSDKSTAQIGNFSAAIPMSHKRNTEFKR